MRFQLRKCPQCKTYTLKTLCSKCDESTVTSHPAKYSPDDKYMRYRLPELYE